MLCCVRTIVLGWFSLGGPYIVGAVCSKLSDEVGTQMTTSLIDKIASPFICSGAPEPPRAGPVLHISDPPAGFPLPLLGSDGQLAELCGGCGLQHPAWVPVHNVELSRSLRHSAAVQGAASITFDPICGSRLALCTGTSTSFMRQPIQSAASPPLGYTPPNE